MAILFGDMIPREITAIKMKMPITRSLEHHQQNLRELNNTAYAHVSSASVPKSEEKLSIADIRAVFKNR